MTVRLLSCAALLLLTTGTAAAHGGGFWYPVSISFCLAQDDSYAQLPSGRQWMQEESIVRFLKELTPAQKTCLVSRKSLSANFCKALLTPQPNADQSDQELEQLSVKYKKELDLLLAPQCDSPTPSALPSGQR